MTRRLFFDTETTGKWDFRSHENSPHQPNMVEVGAQLWDDNHPDGDRLVQGFSFIILPEPDWRFEAEAVAVNGITRERAMQEGVGLALVLELFDHLSALADELWAHNIDFDHRVMRRAMKKGGLTWRVPAHQHCTMKLSTEVCQIPSPRGRGYKWPSLAEAYRHFTGKEIVNAHSAQADLFACRRVWLGLKDGGYLPVQAPPDAGPAPQEPANNERS